VSFSPDGGRFAFLRGRPAESRSLLMIAASDGTGLRELAPAGASSFELVAAPWSPDGRTIAVLGHVTVNGAVRFRLIGVDAETGALSPFGGDWDYLDALAWMPDSRSVVVSASEVDATAIQLWQVTWPTGERRRISSGSNGYQGVSIAADGRTIATIEGEVHSGIWIYPMTGGPGRQITSTVHGSPGGGGLTWTPSGRIVYGMSPSAASFFQLFGMDRDGGHNGQLTTLKVVAYQPTASLDGKAIYFTGSVTDAASSQIWRIPQEGGEPVRLTTGRSDSNPHVSPDGRWVYYNVNEDGRTKAMKISAEGGTPVALTSPEGGFNIDGVSLDGTRLHGFAWNTDGHRRQAATVPTGGGPITYLENAPKGGFLTPDEKSWIVADVIDSVPGLFVKPLEGGKERLLANLGDDQAWTAVVSPDGSSLAVARGHTTTDVILIKARQ
jgi:Tol biopolymer transport system component